MSIGSDYNAYANLEAERSVLGSSIKDIKAAKLAAEMDETDFTAPEHRVLLTAIKELVKAETPIDLVTMDTKLSAGNKLELIGGTVYLMKLIADTPTTANVKSYIQIVRDCSARRKLKEIGMALIEASGSLEADVSQTREDAAVRIRDVKAGGNIRLVSQMDAALSTYERIEDAARQQGQEETERIMTGIRQLDRMTGGLTGSKLVVIGARPSVGKSIFATQIAMNAARHGKRVLYVSLEMEAEEIMEREFAAESLVPLTELTAGEVKDESWRKLAEAMGPLTRQKIWYCTDAFTVEQVRKAAFTVFEDGGIDLICVDYLQLMEATYATRQNRQEQVSEISRGLKKLAQELKVPIIALSQLNRSSQKEKRAPTMSEARESGAIEQDANIFILLHDPDVDEFKTDDKRRIYKLLNDQGMKLIHVNVDKNRQGKKGVFFLAFDGDHMRFLPLAKEEQ